MKTNSFTKITLLSIFVMSAITAITLNSCQKENVKPKIVNNSAKSNAVTNYSASANLLLAEANSFIFTSSNNEKGLFPNGTDTSSCVVITTDTVNKPYSVTYNFGSACVGSDGKTRSGIVSYTYSDKDIRVVNNSIALTFQNYSIDGTTFNGSESVTNNGPNSNGNQVIAEIGNFVSVSQSESDTMSINSQIEWLTGESSSPAANWQFSVTGTIHGGTSTGKTVDITTTSPIIRNAKTPGCNYAIQGTQQMAVTGQPVEYTDYGNPGGCSDLKAETVNGVTTIVNQDAD